MINCKPRLGLEFDFALAKGLLIHIIKEIFFELTLSKITEQRFCCPLLRGFILQSKIDKMELL